MGSKLSIGQVITTNRKADDATVETKEIYQIEKFFSHFVQCRHIKGGYMENFLPHELYINGIISWRQTLDYMSGNLSAVCEV